MPRIFPKKYTTQLDNIVVTETALIKKSMLYCPRGVTKMDEDPEDVGQSTEDIFDQQVETKGGDTVQNPETENTEETGDLTRENISDHQDPLTKARNSNRASVDSLETGVSDDEQGVEDIWDVAQEAAEDNFENQKRFDERTQQEISDAEDIKHEIEASGNIARIKDDSALDFNADIEQRDQEWVDAFNTPGSRDPAVSVSDSLDHAETAAMRWGAGAVDQGLYKGIFDAHKQETGENNRSAGQAADEMSNFRSTWESNYGDETIALGKDFETLFDKVHLTERDTGNEAGEISLVENLRRRASQYEDIKETAEASIEEYENADSEKNPDVSASVGETIKELLGKAEEEIEEGKQDFESEQQERAVKQTWSATRLAALESVEEAFETAREQKETYESLQDDVSERRETYESLQDDVELGQLDGVQTDTAETLQDIGIDNILDLASLSNGGDITSQLNDGPRAERPKLGPNDETTEESAESIVQQAHEEVYGEGEDDTGLAHAYDQALVDTKLEDARDQTVTDREMALQQLQGMYAKATEVTNDLADFEERLEGQIKAYDEAISQVEEQMPDGYDNVESYVEEERDEAIKELNSHLSEDDQIDYEE